MLKGRPSSLYEDANALPRKNWTWHVAALAYVLGWVTTWAALSSFSPAFRILWIFSLPAALLVLWTWFVEDES